MKYSENIQEINDKIDKLEIESNNRLRNETNWRIKYGISFWQVGTLSLSLTQQTS